MTQREAETGARDRDAEHHRQHRRRFELATRRPERQLPLLSIHDDASSIGAESSPELRRHS
jgi:hypothetical protein